MLFSDDCDALNWGLLHLIETAPYENKSKYSEFIERCNNNELKELLKQRFENYPRKTEN